MTLIMLIMIALGIGVAAAALVYVAVVAYRLYKLVKETQATLAEPIGEITQRQQVTVHMLERIQERQVVIERNGAALAQTASNLAFLKTQLTGGLNGLVGRGD